MLVDVENRHVITEPLIGAHWENEPRKPVNNKRVNQIIELAGYRGMVSGTR